MVQHKQMNSGIIRSQTGPGGLYHRIRRFNSDTHLPAIQEDVRGRRSGGEMNQNSFWRYKNDLEKERLVLEMNRYQSRTGYWVVTKRNFSPIRQRQERIQDVRKFLNELRAHTVFVCHNCMHSFTVLQWVPHQPLLPRRCDNCKGWAKSNYAIIFK